jgi:hypothetical protein
MSIVTRKIQRTAPECNIGDRLRPSWWKIRVNYARLPAPRLLPHRFRRAPTAEYFAKERPTALRIAARAHGLPRGCIAKVSRNADYYRRKRVGRSGFEIVVGDSVGQYVFASFSPGLSCLYDITRIVSE